MAPLWGSSWSSNWASLFGYSQVPNSENNATPAAEANPLKPTLGQVLMSKRVRYTGAVVAALALFFLAFRNYDRIPSMETFRGGTATSGDVANSKPGDVANSKSDCPTAVVPAFEDTQVNWSRYAYTQYVTNAAYLCNSVMIFETLFRQGSKPDRLMMYPGSMMDPAETNPSSEDARLLVKARDQYKVKLVPVSVQRRVGGDGECAPW